MNNDNKRSAGGLGLVGDIGGTNARFALAIRLVVVVLPWVPATAMPCR